MERDVERYVRKKVEKMGGLCLKWVCPGRAGVPDRIILMPDGWVCFVELKDDDYRPTELQRYWQKALIRMGFNAILICGLEEAREFIRFVREEVLQDEVYTA